MFKNTNYIDIIDRHPGDRCRIGGEYGYTRRLHRASGGWEVTYTTSALEKTAYCHVFGEWQHCRDCPEFDILDRVCLAEEEIMTEHEVEKLAHAYPDAVTFPQEECCVIDATGHEHQICSHNGIGCTICYPCGHGCNTEGLLQFTFDDRIIRGMVAHYTIRETGEQAKDNPENGYIQVFNGKHWSEKYAPVCRITDSGYIVILGYREVF